MDNLLCRQLDKFSQQRYSFTQTLTKYNLCHDPVLDFIEAANKHIQISSYLKAPIKRNLCVTKKIKNGCVCAV